MKSRTRVWFVAALVTFMLALVPALASGYGYSQHYCGVVKGSGHWCGASGLHSWDFNIARYYNTSARVLVCQRLWVPAFAYTAELTCGWGVTGSSGRVNRTCVCYAAHVNQNSGYNHTVYGYAEA